MLTHSRSTPALRLVILIGLLLALGAPIASAQEAQSLRITSVDASAYPEIKLTFIAAAAGGGAVTDLAGLAISENGTPVSAITTSPVRVGVEVIFVIDANASINERDRTSSSRREKVRDAINDFADRFMDEGQRDRASIIVPPGGAQPDGFLLKDAIFINEVKNAINFYEPSPRGPAPVNDMLLQAINLAGDNQDQGRYQAIVLFSDAALTGSPVDSAGLASRANQQGVSFYGLILGQRADANEQANMTALTGPTNGTQAHMPEPAEATAIWAILQSQATQQQVTYQAVESDGGEATVTLSLGAVSTEASYAVELELPEVTVLLDNSRPITRVAAEADTPLEEMEPQTQKVVAQVTWPDGRPRDLASASLLVNGVVQLTVEDVPVDADGVLEMDWDLREFDADRYDLAVSVTDILGLTGESQPLSLAIVVERPEAVANSDPAQPTVAATAVAPGAATTDGSSLTDLLLDNVFLVVSVVMALLVGFLLLILAVVLIRRRSAAPAVLAPDATPAPAGAAPGPFDAESTQIMAPAFVQKAAGAFLEALENAAEHPGPIFLSGNNIALGRDAKLAQVVFKDKSVSRLHARIMESNGEFRLYDEGSASGTYHNYERVGLTPQSLKDNDEIHLGRVHLRFRMQRQPQDDDATQVFGPSGARPARPSEPVEDLSTQPFMPHGPAAPSTPAAGSGQSRPVEEDPDDLSTKPFMPHDPS